MILEEVQKDVQSQMHQGNNEVERLKQQLASEKKNVSKTSMKLQALKLELERNKNGAEHLKLMERNFAEKSYVRSKSRLELEDANNTIAELKEELAYKSSVNRSLGLQLEKTIESTSELLLEIKDLDDLLQSKETEIEALKADLEGRQANQKLENENASWLIKLEESESKRTKLEKQILKQEAIRASDSCIQDLRAENELLQKELVKTETEIASTNKENMNLLSQLMDLRHETDAKSTLAQQLEQKLAMVQAQSSCDVEALEMKASDLQATANDLREKLRLSEELLQNQLDSNKVFMEDFISTTEDLRARNEQLETLLKSSEEQQSALVKELEALQNELLEHEKEHSLLVSQRVQLKIFREKISTLTENYDIALKREQDLELVIKALKEEHGKTLVKLDEQLKQRDEGLHDANSECMALKIELEKAATRIAQTNEQTHLLLVAKEAAEATLSSLTAVYTELQKQHDSLLVNMEKANASFHSLQAARAELQEHLKNVENRNGEAIRQLQESDIKIFALTEALNLSDRQLKKVNEHTSELEATMLSLQGELQHMQNERRLHNSHIENLQVQLAQSKESLDESSKSLSTSDERIQRLEVRNTDLSEMLQSAVSYKEDVISRLEIALAKELELIKKLQETQQALHGLKNEKLTLDQTIKELQDKICLLKDERAQPVKEKKERDVQDHKFLSSQAEDLHDSIHELKLEKEKAETSLHKLQTTNTSLARELKKWKDKAKASSEELAVWKEIKTSVRLSTSSEETTSLGAKKSSELDQKSELLKLRKQATNLRRKLLEQEEENEDLQKKILSYQKETQRKSELMILIEKRLKEKEKEQRAGQRPSTRLTSSASHRIGMVESNGEKTSMVDLIERVKSLEAELNIKTVELEATRFLLKEKETGPNSNLQMDNQIPKGEHHHKRLTEFDYYKTLHDNMRGLQAENQRLKNLLLKHKEKVKLDNDITVDGIWL